MHKFGKSGNFSVAVGLRDGNLARTDNSRAPCGFHLKR